MLNTHIQCTLLKRSLLSTLTTKTKNKYRPPQSWTDIHKNAPHGSINLLCGYLADFSAYATLSFKVTCQGGFNVLIDGLQYATMFDSNTTCTINWANYTATTAQDITSPQVLKAHRIDILPALSGNNITAYACVKTTTTDIECQGILWANFNIRRPIVLQNAFGNYSLVNPLLESITTPSNTLSFAGNAAELLFFITTSYNGSLKYLPRLDFQSVGYFSYSIPNQTYLSDIRCFGGNLVAATGLFAGSRALQKIDWSNCYEATKNCTEFRSMHEGNEALKTLPLYNYGKAIGMKYFLTNAISLQDCVLDISAATGLKAVGIYGAPQKPISGLKGLLICPNAPFNDAAAPQIKLSYTGLQKPALVQLFASLPTVTAGQVCDITGAAGAAALTAGDIAIATAKGWTITR